MHRIDTPSAQKDKWGAGKNGFTRGNPQTGVPATALDDDYFDAIQEEIASVIESAGIELDKNDKTQLLTALGALFVKAGSGLTLNQITDAELMSAAKEEGSGFVRNASDGPNAPLLGAGVFSRVGDSNTLIISDRDTGKTVVITASDASIKKPAVNVLYGSANKPTASDVGLGAVGNYQAVANGGGEKMLNNRVYIGWSGNTLLAQVDATPMGELYYTANPPPKDWAVTNVFMGAEILVSAARGNAGRIISSAGTVITSIQPGYEGGSTDTWIQHVWFRPLYKTINGANYVVG